MSDLQCPATFLLVRADAAPAVLERGLAHDRVAEVRTVRRPEAVSLARTLARTWGLPDPAGSDVDVTSYPDVLTDLADLRRGETTVVVVDPALLVVVAGRGPGDGPDVVEVRVDADGWVVRERGSLLDGPKVRDVPSG